jgi:citrate synthase
MGSTSLTAHQVASRLGVKVETVYAYVSRGLLPRRLAPDGRTSLFDRDDVEQLARRGRPRAGRGRTGTVDVVLSTAITAIGAPAGDDRLSYRGVDVADLVRVATFEGVAELLWSTDGDAGPASGTRPAPGARHVWSARPEVLAAAQRATTGLAVDGPVAERYAVATAASAFVEPLRVDLNAHNVRRVARQLVVVLADSLPPVGADRPGPPGHRRVLAWRLWPRLSPLTPTRPRVRALDAALMLLADHELATSTLAARVAASTRADPHAVVLAALGATSGPLHGKAAVAVHDMLTAAADPATRGPEQAVADAAAASAGRVPGFGHPVYRHRDPRAELLLDLVEPQCSRTVAGVIAGVREAAGRTTPALANVDFALGALAYAMQMPRGSTEAVFALARTTGWIAHAMEEYAERPLRFRARALFTGSGASA